MSTKYQLAMRGKASLLSRLWATLRLIAPFRPSSGGVNIRILTQLSQSNARIVQKTKDVQAFTEREILACGDVLSAIVDKARDLANESDRAITLSTARSEETAARFFQGMREDILAQETAVQRALELAKGIDAALGAINSLRLSSKMLAINAKIEAARLGEQGRAFEVVANGLSGLSDVISAASDKVGSAIAAVREGLPPVSARAASMRERTKLFVDEVAEQVKSASRGTHEAHPNGGLAELMELSNQALSHLQFQDPMIQKLLSIDHDLDLVTERVRQALNGEDAVEGPGIDDLAGASEPPSGEVLLF